MDNETKEIKVELYKNTYPILIRNFSSYTYPSALKKFLIECLTDPIQNLFKSHKITDLNYNNFEFYSKDDESDRHGDLIDYEIKFDWRTLKIISIKYKEYEEYRTLSKYKEEIDIGNNYTGMYFRWRDDDLYRFGVVFNDLGGSERLNLLKQKYENEDF